MVCSFRLVRYALPRSSYNLCGSAVAWGYLYPFLSSLSSLPSAALFGARLLMVLGAWAGSSLCGVSVRALASPSALCAPASFSSLSLLFVFLWVCLVVSLFSPPLVLSLCPLLSASLSPVLRCLGFLGPLGNHILTIQFVGMQLGNRITDCNS